MRRPIRCLAATALILYMGACRREPARAAHDDATASGKAARPLRVVTLTPSSTEVVAALGGTDLLVGVDQYSTYPPEVQKLPKVGDFLHPNVEAILALAPDIAVLDATQAEVKRKLEAGGITTVASAMQNISDVKTALANVGRALGREKAAEQAIAALDAELATVEKRASDAAAATGRKPRVLVIVDRRPGGFAGMVAAGPGTYFDDLLHHAAADNALADAPMRYAQISAEEILARAPDVIFDVTHVDDPGAARADWNLLSDVPAVKNGRVHVLADERLLSPGPRLGGALARLVDLLWPPAR